MRKEGSRIEQGIKNLHFSSFTKAFGGKAFAFGSAHNVGRYSGADLWFPPSVQPDVNQLMALMQSTNVLLHPSENVLIYK